MGKDKKLLTIRKLVSIGGDSYGVTLPKDWITKNKIKVGDTMVIKVEQMDIDVNAHISELVKKKLK